MSMNSDTSKYLLIGAVGGLLVGWLLAGASNYYGMSPGMMRGERREASPTSVAQSQLDAHYIEQMIPHHEDAIVMAELALEKSSNVQIRQLADDIIRTQRAEIEQMQQWYEEWYDRRLPTGNDVMQQHGMMGRGGLHMSATDDDLQALAESADFDRSFVLAMIPHHQMAVMMTSMMLQGTERPEMRELGDAVIEAQSKEIDMMRQWLEDGTL